MKKEDLSMYEDGMAVNEADIATAVAKLENAVIYRDDAGSVFFLIADPDAFDIGTVARTDDLMPVDVADEQLRKKIDAAVRGL